MILKILVNPAQTGGMKNLKQKRQALLQTKRIQKYVTAGVLYLKHLNLDCRINRKENHMGEYYQPLQDRKEAELPAQAVMDHWKWIGIHNLNHQTLNNPMIRFESSDTSAENKKLFT
ncbi:uncharacterized protein LOC111867897 [Cryptotermes secundus]|uniref:uncharacterized protein LOC111867897 n=1 Tax=Cryptotermes secundus TaxID=105785 RepID=UPI000CD7AD93|nr:uncharacterized protein LOC111867897 [Cryptotermes secundus]